MTDPLVEYGKLVRDRRAVHSYVVTVESVNATTARCGVRTGTSDSIVDVPYLIADPTVNDVALLLTFDDLAYVIPGHITTTSGPPGASGDQWETGAGNPTNTTVNAFDVLYLNTSNGSVWQKLAGQSTYTQLMNITGPQGPQGTQGPQGVPGTNLTPILSGFGPPSAATGTDGAYYVDSTAHIMYGPKVSAPYGPGESYNPETNPVNQLAGDDNSVGTEIKLLVDTRITGIRWYRWPNMTTTTRTLRIWRVSDSTQIASVVTSGETGTGWRTTNLATPIVVPANTTLRVVYSMVSGGGNSYGYSTNFASLVPAHATILGGIQSSALTNYPTITHPTWQFLADVVAEPSNVPWPLAVPPPAVPPTPSPDVQTFTANGTWTKPANAKLVQFVMCGAGGGGGSGRKGAAGTNRFGGGGGGGGSLTYWNVPAASLPATGSVFIGLGGNGAVAQATASTNGNAGSPGGSSRVQFGSTASIYASGGVGGTGGTATTGTGGVGGTYGTTQGGAGGAGGAGVGANQPSAPVPGGSGGGGISTTNVASNGGSTGNSFAGTLFLMAGAVAGGVVDGALPQDGIPCPIVGPATQGCGGGAASITTNAQKGGNGALYGGGGGGGGASLDGVGDSGAGGNGAAGFVQVITYF